ncbi:MAG TPA: hypothetical protein VGN14_19175 [Candidatus Elarobacter sp.]|jgi:hypothetical protein
MFRFVLRAALIIGAAIDAWVGILALLAQQLVAPLLDIPVKDPAMTTIYGGALLVVAGIYLIVLRDPARFRPLLWLCALDQTFGIALPLLEIGRGHLGGSWKVYAPMPAQLALIVVYLVAARARP